MLASVLVTGASSGIGAATARCLAARGVDVVISGRRGDALAAVADSSSHISASVGDISVAEHRMDLASTFAEMTAPRALFHAAGFFQTGLLDTLDADDWRRSFEVNVTARFELTQACAPLLDGGRVLFVDSDAGANPRAGAVAYSVAQAASATLRRGLQTEWRSTDRAVSAFKPGLVVTEMVRGFLSLPPEQFPARAAYDEYVSSGRVTTPDVVARFATWLLLDVDTPRFVETEWDIRDDGHRAEWLDEPLYPDAD